MAVNKSLGVAQAQAAPVFISLLLGPVAVGVFDALTRLPRFAKTVLGLLSSTVLPVAARLESDLDNKGLRRLGQTGALMAGLVALPPVGAAMVFSKPILLVWLGNSLTYLWYWQAMMFVVPAVSILVGFGGAALVVRPQALAAMNRLVIVQILIQFGLAFALVGHLHERAFILGQVVALCITFFWQMRLISRELQTPSSAAWRLTRIVFVVAAMALPGVMVHPWLTGPWQLFLAMAAWTILCWMACLALVLSADQRQRLFQICVSKLDRFGRK